MNPDICIKGEGFVRGRYGIHIICFTIGSLAAVEFFAVPGCFSGLSEVSGMGHGLVPVLSDLVRLGIAAGTYRWRRRCFLGAAHSDEKKNCCLQNYSLK